MRSRSTGASGLVFGAIMAALVVVFSLIPFLSIMLPIPLVLAYLRYGPRVAVLSSVVAVVFSGMFRGVLPALLIIPAGVLPGLVFGYGFSRRYRPLTVGLIAVVVFFFGFAFQYVLLRALMFDGNDPFVMVAQSEEFQVLIERTLGPLETQLTAPPNASPATVQMMEMQRSWFKEMRENPVPVIWVLLPSALFLFGAFSTWINYMLCRLVLPRFGHEVPAPAPFANFRLPAWLIWSYTLLLLSMTYLAPVSTLSSAPWWFQVILNLLTPLMLIVILAGVAVAFGYLRKQEVAPGIALLISLLGLMLGALGTQLYIMLAIWDSIFDFRRLGHGFFRRPEGTP